MKKISLATLLENIKYLSSESRITDTSLDFDHISFDSRDITKNSCFVAIKGTVNNGHQFIQEVVEKGCKIIICEKLPENFDSLHASYIVVPDSHIALSQISALYYDHPSTKLTLVGITGTNGKTTTATLLYQLVRKLGYKAGLISTVTIFVNEKSYEATHTTPDPLTLQKYMAMMVEEGCRYCFMEVSSHALIQHRTDNLLFKVAVFTNITLDHLDYHKTFLAYINAKKMLFDNLPKDSTAIINADDKNGATMVQNCKAKILRFGMHVPADINGKLLEQDMAGMLLKIGQTEFWSHLIGEFNGHNLLSIYSVVHALGFSDEDIFPNLSELKAVAGRFEYIRFPNGITGIVDYAHTPDALKNVLETIQNIRKSGENIITIVGCGGNRDKSKRPLMAQIACLHSDKVILTSDNPRFEDPNDILNDMKQGIPASMPSENISILSDRKLAIQQAVKIAKSGDIILLAGKGHENYQIVGTTKHHFDDKEEIILAFNNTKKQTN